MKKLTLALSITAAFFIAQAQPGNNSCTYSAIYSYTVEGGGPQDLERGIKCSDEAAVHEATAPISKTWFYRAQLYTLVFSDSVLKGKYGNAAFEALKAFQKLHEINDPKFK